MARSRFTLGLAAALSVTLAGAAVAQSAGITVPLNQTHRLQVRGQASAVIVGNPEIADVTVVDANTLYVTGKGPGSTQVVVVDGVGRVLADRLVEVTSDARGQVRVWRGAAVSEMSCASSCVQTGGAMPAPAGAPTPVAGIN